MLSFHSSTPKVKGVEPIAVSEAVAARLMSVSPRSLWTMRHEGRGPRFCRVGKQVRYRVADLHSWLAEQAAAEGGEA